MKQQRDTEALSGGGLNRRDALKRGAVVAGGLVWATPAIQALGLSAAHADDPSAPPPPPPPPPQTGKIPSHAIFLVDCGGTRYGLKLDGALFDKIASPSDKDFLKKLGFSWSNPTPTVLALFAGHGAPGVDPNGELALVLQVPAECSLVTGAAVVFDGGLQNCGNGDKYQNAKIVGDTVYFYGACHE
jgi:hypothetical protein